jgi:AraC family transcriptional regulator
MQYLSDLYRQPPLASSVAHAWKGILVERYRFGAMQLPPHHHQQHLLIVYGTETPLTVRRQRGGVADEEVFHTDDVGIYPGGEYGAISWNGPNDNVHVSVDDAHLEQLARDSLGLEQFHLTDRFNTRDPLLTQLVRQLLGAVGAARPVGLLYVEALTAALCHHLIEHHATYRKRLPPRRQPLSAAVLARVDAYLEVHAEYPITLDALAELAHLSVYHFAKLFKYSTGQSPYQYVLAWKLAQARLRLRRDENSIADIGEALGFASPAHFAAAFRRGAGLSPREYRQG